MHLISGADLLGFMAWPFGDFCKTKMNDWRNLVCIGTYLQIGLESSTWLTLSALINFHFLPFPWPSLQSLRQMFLILPPFCLAQQELRPDYLILLTFQNSQKLCSLKPGDFIRTSKDSSLQPTMHGPISFQYHYTSPGMQAFAQEVTILCCATINILAQEHQKALNCMNGRFSSTDLLASTGLFTLLALSWNTAFYINIFFFTEGIPLFRCLISRTLKQLTFYTTSVQMVQLCLEKWTQQSPLRRDF